jgi:Ala-tRNA(Pro) deacylase
MPSPLLIDYLNRCRAVYQLQRHEPVVTAAEAAALHRIPLRHFAKPVLVRTDDALAMVIVPANYRLALESLRGALGAGRVELASERHFRHRFPRCELGAMPPFGHLFGLNAYAPPLFDANADIVFKAGSHAESVRMAFAEFRRFAHFDPIEQGVLPRLREPSSWRIQRLRGFVPHAPHTSLVRGHKRPANRPILALQGR